MKTIGIIGAMDEEVAGIKARMDVISAQTAAGIDFIIGKMKGKNVVLSRCGIGKVNAAVCTQILIDLFGVDCVINIGLAGAVSKELEIGDIVISSELVQHDMDATIFGNSLGQIPRMAESFFKADGDMIKIAMESGEEALPDKKVIVGRIASGDQFISSGEQKQKLWKNFQALCCEMEGAAIGHTCFLNKIPFVVIRDISDKADDSATTDFNRFVEEAAEGSAALVESMLQRI